MQLKETFQRKKQESQNNMKLEKAILTEDMNQLNEYTNEVYDRKSRVRSLLREELDSSTALKRIKEVG